MFHKIVTFRKLMSHSRQSDSVNSINSRSAHVLCKKNHANMNLAVCPSFQSSYNRNTMIEFQYGKLSTGR